MSDTNGDKKPKPIFNPDDVAEPAVDFGPADPKPAVDFGPADPTPADVAVEEPAVEKPAVEEPAEKSKPARKPKADKDANAPAADAAATGSVAPSSSGDAATESAFAGREVVYVQAPIPPRLRGNRGVGSLLAVLGAALFAALYAAAGFLYIALGFASPGASFANFVVSPEFLIPVPIFLIAFVLLVLIVNRGGWAAHIFGSLLVGLAVYFGSAGVVLLLRTVGGGDVPTFGYVISQPLLIIAALVAREVSIWIGLAIAARGRRVKAKNLELVDEWEQEHAETKAQYERAGSTT